MKWEKTTTNAHTNDDKPIFKRTNKVDEQKKKKCTETATATVTATIALNWEMVSIGKANRAKWNHRYEHKYI